MQKLDQTRLTATTNTSRKKEGCKYTTSNAGKKSESKIHGHILASTDFTNIITGKSTNCLNV